MDWLRLLDTEKFLLFTLVLTRVSGLMMTAPVYGMQGAPVMVRAVVSLALAVLVMPAQWAAAPVQPGSLPQYVLLLGSELLLGACLGLGIVVLLAGIQMAGELIGRVGGLTLADVFDPSTGTDVPLLSRLLYLVAVAVFVGIGGHRMVMAGLLDTFHTLPPGGGLAALLDSAQTASSGGMLRSIVDTFVVLIQESFSLGIRASIPVVTAVLVATLALGLVSRTLPQLNVLVVGLGLNSMLTFAVLSLSLGAAAWAFHDQVEPAVEMLLRAMKGTV
jgi:flagellar biosynthesis protein FliR